MRSKGPKVRSLTAILTGKAWLKSEAGRTEELARAAGAFFQQGWCCLREMLRAILCGITVG